MLSHKAKDRYFDIKARPVDLPLNHWADSLKTEKKGQAATCFHHQGRHYIAWRAQRAEALERYSMSETLSGYGLPVAEPLTMRTREDSDGEATIVFCVLPEGAVPMEDMLSQCRQAAERDALTEALAGLLVHLHLTGFHFRWGVAPQFAFRHEDKGFTAFLMNAMEGEILDDCEDHRRAIDLQATTAVLEHHWHQCFQVCSLEEATTCTEQCNNFLNRYRNFWSNISCAGVFADQRAIVTTRVAPLREVGLIKQNIDTHPGFGFMLRTRVIHHRYHKMLLHMLTGIAASGNNGARKLLADINRYRSWLEYSSGRKWSKALAANHWLNEIYYPAVKGLPMLQNMAAV